MPSAVVPSWQQPFITVSSTLMLRFEHAIAASQGARNYQEDAAGVWTASEGSASAQEHAQSLPSLVAVLADGMGGHRGGAVASAVAIRAFLDAFPAAEGTTPERLGQALYSANSAMALAGGADPTLRGMGCTLLGVTLSQAGLEWISVGDSPLFLFRQGRIKVLNEDHSLAPALDELAAEGVMSAAQARADPRRHVLRSAVTGDDMELIDVSPQALDLAPGDYVLLASDGIHTLEPDAIAQVLDAHAEDGATAAAEALLRAVAQRHDRLQDNTTVVSIKVGLV
jgi:protein phosphatase